MCDSGYMEDVFGTHLYEYSVSGDEVASALGRDIGLLIKLRTLSFERSLGVSVAAGQELFCSLRGLPHLDRCNNRQLERRLTPMRSRTRFRV